MMAMLMLVLKIIANRNVLGLSYRTQEIYLVVYVTRYIGIIFGWTSFYLFAMKILFISITAYTIYLIKFKKPISLVCPASLRATISRWIVSPTITFTGEHSC